MNITSENNNVIIKNIEDFDLAQTLECGQCFRFHKLGSEDFVVIASGRAVRITHYDNKLVIYNTTVDDVTNFWIQYFDLDRDYGAIKTFLLDKDARLEGSIKEKSGIRIMNQQFDEMLISFIISQNKQIPHIKKIVEQLCETYGDYITTIEGQKYYSFPSNEKLAAITEDGWRELKVGFRAPYLYEASQKLGSGQIISNSFYNNEQLIDAHDANQILTSIKGVGDKVASCVMLFALGYRSAFPIDVWIKRIMEYMYFDGKDTSKNVIADFAQKQYGEYGGYAQQYLFSFGRELQLGK